MFLGFGDIWQGNHKDHASTHGSGLIDAAKMASAAAALNMVAFGPMEGRISREAVFEKIKNEMIEERL